MANIGELVMGVKANTSQATRNIKRFRKEVSLTSRLSKLAIKPIGGFATALTGVGLGLSAAGVGAALASAASNIDKIAKTSARLGIGTEELVGLQHAARQTGVETATLDMALQRQVRRLSEAANGTGEALKALDEMGLSAARLNKLAPEKQFALLADELNKVENQADRVRLAMRFWDSEGVKLVQTTALGSKGLANMQAEAEKLGKTFTDEQAKRVEAFNDSLSKLKDLAGSIGQKIVIDIAPAAVEAVDGLMLWMNRYKTGKDETRSLPAGQSLLTRHSERAFRERERAFAARIGGTSRQRTEELAISGAAGARNALAKTGESLFNIAKANLIPASKAFKDASALLPGTTEVNKRILAMAIRNGANQPAILKESQIANNTRMKHSEAGILQRGSAEAFLALRAKATGTDDKHLKVQHDQLDRLEQIAANTIGLNVMQGL